MKCYKVVRRVRDRLYSAVIEESVYQVEYIPGEWAKGLHGTPLLVFESRAAAVGFRHTHDYEAWECEATRTRPIKKLPPYRKTSGFLRYWQWSSWFRLAKAERPKTAVVLNLAPDATLAAARVKLTKKIPR